MAGGAPAVPRSFSRAAISGLQKRGSRQSGRSQNVPNLVRFPPLVIRYEISVTLNCQLQDEMWEMSVWMRD